MSIRGGCNLQVACCRSEFEVHANGQRETDFVKKTGNIYSPREIDFVAGAL